jgi:hypothetical protein
MAAWLQDYPAIRALPRLWVERVWLLESREPLTVVREVALRPGVNVVWAKEPETEAGSGLASAGHGVGKTSFCLLLRYLLGDEATAISTLREKAAASFPKGGVAAQVHVDGVSWLVYRPYAAFGHSLAKPGFALDSLFEEPRAGDFSAYQAALQTAFIGRLPAQTLPGTNQPLEWRHLLAWCIREQRTRFDGFFHWREGDGLGFRRPRQDPPLFVTSVLGILDSGIDALMRDIERLGAEQGQVQAQIPELERLPVFELERLERRLRSLVGAGDDCPLYESITEDSLEALVKLHLKAAEASETALEAQAVAAEAAMTTDISSLSELGKDADRCMLEKGIAQSLLDAKEDDYRRLTNELEELDRLVGHCKHGKIDFDDCQHIKVFKATVSLPWRMDAMAAKASVPERRKAVEAAASAEAAAKRRLEEQAKKVAWLRAGVARLRMRAATSSVSRTTVEQEWSELQLRDKLRKEGKDTAELQRARMRDAELGADLASKKSALVQRRQQASARVDRLKAMTSLVAQALLGEPGHGRFLPESDFSPFDLAVGGEAYQVLEVLLGDLTCLLDAATSNDSNHPGFLVHDCPREADMSALLYRNFLMMALDANNQLATGDGAPFQYIVTTTSAPPAKLCVPPYLVLELQPGIEEALLFKRKLERELPGFVSDGEAYDR